VQPNENHSIPGPHSVHAQSVAWDWLGVPEEACDELLDQASIFSNHATETWIFTGSSHRCTPAPLNSDLRNQVLHIIYVPIRFLVSAVCTWIWCMPRTSSKYKYHYSTRERVPESTVFDRIDASKVTIFRWLGRLSQDTSIRTCFLAVNYCTLWINQSSGDDEDYLVRSSPNLHPAFQNLRRGCFSRWFAEAELFSHFIVDFGVHPFR